MQFESFEPSPYFDYLLDYPGHSIHSGRDTCLKAAEYSVNDRAW